MNKSIRHSLYLIGFSLVLLAHVPTLAQGALHTRFETNQDTISYVDY